MNKIDIKRITKDFNGVALIDKKGSHTQLIVEGYSDFDKKDKHTANSKFLICSVSKMFTAVAINQLCEKNLLKKEDLMSKYIPKYFKEHPITIYQLLTHTSGLPNYVMYRKELDWNTLHTEDEIFGVIESKPLKFKPGTKWSYSNTGYYLLALIVEKITGMKYEEYVLKNILEVAHMKDTSFATKENIGLLRPHIKGKYTHPIHFSLLFGAGDIVSTAKDLYLFGKGLMEGTLVNKETLNQMSRPVFSNNKIKYGEGLFVNEHFGTLQIGHSGSMPGYATQLSIYPEKEIISVVLTNNRKMIHPLVYADANGKYIDTCLAEQVLGKKLSIIKKAYL